MSASIGAGSQVNPAALQALSSLNNTGQSKLVSSDSPLNRIIENSGSPPKRAGDGSQRTDMSAAASNLGIKGSIETIGRMLKMGEEFIQFQAGVALQSNQMREELGAAAEAARQW